jgi:hypothetical protein
MIFTSLSMKTGAGGKRTNPRFLGRLFGEGQLAAGDERVQAERPQLAAAVAAPVLGRC